MDDQSDDPTAYLSSMINRTLHLHTSDGRTFVGQMKCTDNEQNIILAMTHEYRRPGPSEVELAKEKQIRSTNSADNNSVKVDMKKRFVGLVVVPGQYITKIELESYG